jgi:hypothetical protein
MLYSSVNKVGQLARLTSARLFFSTDRLKILCSDLLAQLVTRLFLLRLIIFAEGIGNATKTYRRNPTISLKGLLSKHSFSVTYAITEKSLVVA